MEKYLKELKEKGYGAWATECWVTGFIGGWLESLMRHMMKQRLTDQAAYVAATVIREANAHNIELEETLEKLGINKELDKIVESFIANLESYFKSFK